MRLARRSRPERQLVGLLRQQVHSGPPGPDAVEDPLCRDAFAALAEAVLAAGLEILPPSALLLGQDERMILGGLAQAQRVRNDVVSPVDPALLDPLRWSAAAALTAGVILPHRAVLSAPRSSSRNHGALRRDADAAAATLAWLQARQEQSGAPSEPALAALSGVERNLAVYRRRVKAARSGPDDEAPPQPSRIV